MLRGGTNDCGASATRRRIASRSVASGAPASEASSTRPAVGLSTVASACISVVLPAPFTPTRPVTPVVSAKSRSAYTTRSP